MSTKAIREALEWMKAECGAPRVATAMREVEAIERAATALSPSALSPRSESERRAVGEAMALMKVIATDAP